jgi:hypothetical protein
LAIVVVVVVVDLTFFWKERERETHTHARAHSACLCVCLRAFWVFFQQWELECPESWENAIIIMLVPPRKRKQVQTMNTTSCAIGQLWIHSFLRICTGKICRKLSQLGFWGVRKERKTPLPTNHCWYRNFCYFLFFCSNLHSFSLSSGFEKKATFWAPQTTIALRLCAWFFWGCR